MPLHVQYATDASSEENIQINSEWILGMPKVKVEIGLGHKEETWMPPTFGSNEKGGMNAKELEKYLLANVV